MKATDLGHLSRLAMEQKRYCQWRCQPFWLPRSTMTDLMMIFGWTMYAAHKMEKAFTKLHPLLYMIFKSQTAQVFICYDEHFWGRTSCWIR